MDPPQENDLIGSKSLLPAWKAQGNEKRPMVGRGLYMAERQGFRIFRSAENHALRLKPPRRNATDVPPARPLDAFRPHRFESLPAWLRPGRKRKRPIAGALINPGGETGIRTLDTLLTYTRFPIVLLRPARTSLRVYVWPCFS